METLVLQVVGGIVGLACFAAAFYVAKFYKEHAEDNYYVNKSIEIFNMLKSYETLADFAVRYVEQLYVGTLHGPEKLQMAKEKLVEMAGNMGLDIDIDDIDTIIEQAVQRMNEGFTKGKE